MADYELIGLNEAAPDLRAPTAADTGVVSNLTVTGVLTSSSGEVVGAGTSPETTPLNQYLGGMAFQSPESVVIKPQAVAVPNGVGDMTFQATSDSVIEMEYKGSDAVVRTAQIPLSNERLAMLSRVTPLRQAVRVAMTAAASGSTGIQVLDNANADFGTGNFTLHWEGSLPDWTPSATQSLILKFGSSLGYGLQVLSAGTVQLLFGGGSTETYISTSATGLADGASAKISIAVVRETASVAGSVTFYVNGVQLGASVAIGARATPNSDNALSLYIAGSNAVRTASDTTNAIIYNRALSAAEVLSLSVNGPALADLGGSQTAKTIINPSFEADTGTATTGGSTISGWEIFASGSAAAVVEGTAPNGSNVIRFTAADANSVLRTGTLDALAASRFHLLGFWARSISGNTSLSPHRVPSSSHTGAAAVTLTASWVYYEVVASVAGFTRAFYFNLGGAGVCEIDLVSAKQIGITGQWNAEDAQSDTGQIFDSSGNGNHALLPAAGATIIPAPTSDIQVRGKLTWTASSTAQDVVGVNQAIIPVNGVWQPTFMIRSSGSITVNIGDGVDADRYGAAVVLAAGVNIVTPLLRTHDGTNRRLVITPTGSSTATINVLAKYDIVEAV